MKHILKGTTVPASLRPAYVFFLVVLLLLNYFLAQYDKFILSYFQDQVIRTLHLTSTQYGLLSGYATGIVSALTAIPVAFVADYTGARVWTLCAAAVWWNICVIFQSYSNNFWQIFLARLAMSIGQSPVEALSVSLISDYIPTKWLFLTESILYVGVYIGEAVSAQIATVFLKTDTPWTEALRAIAIAGLVLITVLRLVAREPERKVIDTFKPSSHVESPQLQSIAPCPQISSGKVDPVPGTLKHPSLMEGQPTPSILSPLQSTRPKIAPLILESVKYVVSMKSFWILTLSSGARQFSGNLFGYYMPSYLSIQYPQVPNMLSHYGIIVGAVGSGAVLLGGLVCSSRPKSPAMALYITAIGGMLSAPFVVCMVFSKNIGQDQPSNGVRILFGTMSAAYITAELWLGAFASLLVSVLPPQIKTVCLAIYTCIIILIYSSAPQMIGLALRKYDVGSASYIHRTRDILAILIPVGYWVAGIGLLLAVKPVLTDIEARRRAETDGYSFAISKRRAAAFICSLGLLAALTISLLVTSLVVT